MSDLPDKVNELISEWCEPKPKPEQAAELHWTSPDGFWIWSGQQWIPAYDFPGSRDACAEFERLVRKDRQQQRRYLEAIVGLSAEYVTWQSLEAAIFATPAQRCEALLKVIRELERLKQL